MEYGCGAGLVGLDLANRLASLVAADSSPGMLEILKAKISLHDIWKIMSKKSSVNKVISHFNRESWVFGLYMMFLSDN